jgi:hypothetical protein
MNNNIFTLDVPCCMGENATCICGNNERVLRAYAKGEDLPPMSEAQRIWCANEADYAGEGAYPRQEGIKLNDKDLAAWVLSAWNDYVRSNML